MRKLPEILFLLILVLVFSLAMGDFALGTGSGLDGTTAGKPQSGPAGNVIVDKGVRVEFAVKPASTGQGGSTLVMEDEYAEVQFAITDETSGAPVTPLEPAVWISRVRETDENMSCRDRIGRYIQGLLSFQADIDLNKYFILIMNNDRTISVVDPLLGVSGITQLYTMITLKESGEDWVFTPDGKRLFVSMPKANSVAVVDLESFKVLANVTVGANPVRVVLQPDNKYLWVGNDGRDGENSGITVIDATTYAVAARIPIGSGHHEIAFSDDSLHAFITSSIEGTVTVIDTQKLEKIKDLSVGDYPVAVQFSSLSKDAYVASEGDESITVVDGTSLEITGKIPTETGLISLRAAPGGRWLFAANIKRDRVDVVDAANGSITHSFETGDQPYQFAFTDTYAYVRHLGTAEVTLIPLQQLDRKAKPAVQKVLLGNLAPGKYQQPSVAGTVSSTGEWTAVVAANPADKMVYYYMEGMIAPMGSYTTYGRVPRAVGVVDRSVRETEKGVYTAKFKVSEAGTYSVAFLIDSPVVDQCFTFTAEPNSLLQVAKERGKVRLEFINHESNISVGKAFKVMFSLTRSFNDEPLNGLNDIMVIATRMPGNWQERQRAKSVGEGRYEVSFVPDQAGAYLISVSIPSLLIDVTELPYRSFRAVESKTSKTEL